MFAKIRCVSRKIGHGIWVSLQEQGAIRYGLPIELDASRTGDRFILSPVITEVHQEIETVTTTSHKRK